MSTYYYGPALESELDFRRTELRHGADVDRLARAARGSTRAARAARRLTSRSRGSAAAATRAA